MRGISKSFGPVKANEAVDLEVAPGEILGLLGENGAGKTTLMNILFGAYQPDAGEIRVNGAPVTIGSSAAETRSLRIARRRASTAAWA